MLLSFFRIIKFAWQDFWRNFWLSFVTITILILTLLSINFLLILKAVSNTAVQNVQDKINITLYFTDEAEEEKIKNFRFYLNELPEVKEVNYISADKALEQFKDRYKDNEQIIGSLDELEDNPLTGMMVIKARKTDDYSEILNSISSSPYNYLIDSKDFDDHQIIINRISLISYKINQVGLFLILVFGIIAALIIFNTIRIAIYTHRREIRIMKLVGATNWFIRLPYLVEAIFYALIALIVSIVVTLPLLNVIYPYVNNFFIDAEVDLFAYFTNNGLLIFGWQLITIIILNIIASSIAIKKYLNV